MPIRRAMDNDNDELRRCLRAELTSARRLQELASQSRTDALSAAFDADVLPQAEVATLIGLSEARIAQLEALHRRSCRSAGSRLVWLPSAHR